jgi:glucose-6-phosphate dehydrogenase assembly protein OpcA
VATVTRPGFPDREAALHRRTTEGLIAEELRRLDPDDIYGETLEALRMDAARTAAAPARGAAGTASGRRTATTARTTRRKAPR